MLNFFMGLLRKRGEKNFVILCSGGGALATPAPSSYASGRQRELVRAVTTGGRLVKTGVTGIGGGFGGAGLVVVVEPT